MQLELHLHEMQIELENLVWDRKELQRHLQTAIKEHKMMEIILAELEDDHDKAISKIELLQSEVNIYSLVALENNFQLWFLSSMWQCTYVYSFGKNQTGRPIIGEFR